MMSEYTKDLEVVDFFTVFMVIHVGLLWGMLFGVVNMLFPRIFGPMEDPTYTIFDALLFIPCAISAFFAYNFFNQNILFTLYTFTIVRYAISFLLVLILEPGQLPRLCLYCGIGIPIAYLGNTVLVLLFGDYTFNMIKNGLAISWGLIGIFIIVLGLVGISKLVSKIPNPELKSKTKI